MANMRLVKLKNRPSKGVFVFLQVFKSSLKYKS